MAPSWLTGQADCLYSEIGSCCPAGVIADRMLAARRRLSRDHIRRT
jgi:hypothetical protein